MTQALAHDFASVLTGDLVASRRHGAEALDEAMQVLDRASRDIGEDLDTKPVFQRHRGDGWQLVLPMGQYGLRAALRIQAALAAAGSLATRIGIGVGPAHIPDDGDLAAASGAAFHMAGDVLAGLARGTHLALPPIPGALGDALGALMLFVDREAQGWNRTQGQALFEALRIQTPTQEEIAQKVGVTRQAVQSRLSGTALDALQETLRVYESRIDTIRDAL
ncbi:hypothetical protein [uncultured Mameliella sp.]|uniref:hypothetical protein n=1 Tax=uncultured Mameliella sp. TaxID=1447087 RepID=UPI0026305483|nr:hypothetical protein [uncultured Mameliella sp.]